VARRTCNGPQTIEQSGLSFLVGIQFFGGLTFDFDRATSGIITSHQFYEVQGCIVGGLHHRNQARVHVNKGTKVLAFAPGPAYDAILTAFNGGPGDESIPGLDFHGECEGDMNLGTLPNTAFSANPPHYDLQEALLDGGTLTVSSADARVGGATIDARGSVIPAIVTDTNSQILTIDVRSGFRPALTFDAFLRLNRDTEILELSHDGLGANTYTFGVGLLINQPPFPADGYNVIPVPDAPIAAVGEIPSNTARGTASFAISSTGPARLFYTTLVGLPT
jgi:hypothetical protein